MHGRPPPPPPDQEYQALYPVIIILLPLSSGWQYVYKWDSRLHPAVGFPRQTSDIFKNLNWGVDAAVSLPEGDQERIYIFKVSG